MERLYTLVPHDKALHVIVCALIALGAAHAAPQIGLAAWDSALAASAAVSIGYEALQWWRKTGHASPADALAGIAGGVIVALGTLA